MSGGSREQTVGYRYYIGMHMGFCEGPVDRVAKIQVGERTAWRGAATTSQQLTIDSPNLFGGDEREGGVSGAVDLMMGEPAQTANTYLSSVLGGVVPAFRGLMSLVLRQCFIGSNNPYIKPWAVRARRVLKGWQDDAPWYSAKAEITFDITVADPYRAGFVVSGSTGAMLEVDLDTGTILSTTNAAEGATLEGNIVQAAGRLYVADDFTQQLQVFDPTLKTLTALIVDSVDFPYFEELGVSPDGAHVYAGARYNSDTRIYKIATATNTVVATWTLGFDCSEIIGILFVPGDSSLLYLVTQRTFGAGLLGDVRKIQTSDGSITGTLGLTTYGQGITAAAMSPLGRLFVAAFDSIVSIFVPDLIVAGSVIPLASNLPVAFGFSSTGAETYVGYQYAQTLYVLAEDQFGAPTVNTSYSLAAQSAVARSITLADGGGALYLTDGGGGNFIATKVWTLDFTAGAITATWNMLTGGVAGSQFVLADVLSRIENVASMNPAHIVYECLTNSVWGMGYSPAIINDTNFRAAADVFFAEGLGLCLHWTQQQPIQEFVQVVLDHAGAVLAQNVRTGLFELTPIRGGYDVESLPIFGPAEIQSVDLYERPAPPDAINEVSIKFSDIATAKAGSITVQNIAAITAQGGVVTQGKTYPGLPTSDLALRIGMRDLMALSTPLARVRIRVNRTAYDVRPGSLFRLAWPKLGISQLVVRVLNVDGGTLTSGSIQIAGVEDVFGMPSGTYAEQQPSGWVEPAQDPLPVQSWAVREANYYEHMQALSQSALSTLANDAGFGIAMASREQGLALDYGMHVSASNGVMPYVLRDRGPYCPAGAIPAGGLAPGATTVTLTGLIDADLVEVGGYAQISTQAPSHEIVRVDAFNPTTGALTMGRGACGTVAKAHLAGARVLFSDRFNALDTTERVATEIVAVKLTPRTGSGEVTLAQATAASIIFNQVAFRPYPPGRLRIGGQAYPASVTATPLTISWSHRNRVLQNLEGDESTDIGPEVGVTYRVELQAVPGFAVIDVQEGIAGTSYVSPVIPNSITQLRLLVTSSRGGLGSAQGHDYTFAHTAPATGPGRTLTAAASMIAGTATGSSVTAPGATVQATSSMIGGSASGG